MIKHITHKMKNWIAKLSYKLAFLVQVTKKTYAEFQKHTARIRKKVELINSHP